MTQSNPLAKHFRQPAIFLKLPSQGRYWPEGALTLSATGDIPVYPMTTKDEITLRTPDSLMNGTAVVEVIKSCIPAIADPWSMPSVDVDACLIAIRIASYGNDMNVTSNCPKCNHINDNTVDLAQALEQVTMPDYSTMLVDDNLTIKLKPQNYFAINKSNSITYKEQRIMEVLSKTDISPADKEINLKQVTDELIELNVDTLTASTEYILTSDGVRVSDPAHIKEFYSETSGALVKKIQDKLGTIAESAGIKPYTNTCEECENQYITDVTFDYASFFGLGS